MASETRVTRYWQSGQTGLVFAGDTPPLIHEPGWREVIPVPKSEHEGLLRLKAAVVVSPVVGFRDIESYRHYLWSVLLGIGGEAALRERMKGGGV